MNLVTLEVCAEQTSFRRFAEAMEGRAQGSFLSFASPELLFKVLSGKRWQLLKIMTGAGPLAIREVARRAKRDVKAVHGDLHALLAAGLLEKTEDRRLLFPYDAIQVSFQLAAA